MENHIRLTGAPIFAGWPQIAGRLATGQKFNAYAFGDHDEDGGWLVCIGPVTNAFSIVETADPAVANLIVDALRFAAEQPPAICVAGPHGVMVSRDDGAAA